MAKNKYLKIALNSFIVLFLSAIFIFSLLNIFTIKVSSISSFDFFAKFFVKQESFDQKKLGHQIGQKDESLSTNHETFFKATPQDFKGDGENYLTLGPGIFLLPGEYNLSFDLAGASSPPDSQAATIDVFRLERGVIAEESIAAEDLSMDPKLHSFDFETSGGDKFEFRVYYFGSGELEAGRIKLERKKVDFNLLFGRASNYLRGLKFF